MRRRPIYAATVALVLGLSACSSDPTDSPSTGTSGEATAPTEDTPEETAEPPATEVDAVITSEGMPVPVEDGELVTLDFEGATEPEELTVSVITEGDGKEVTREDMVVVDYAGQVWGSDETFDSSYERGAPSAFPLNQVVQGWRDGLAGQKVGSRVVVSVPAELGYGPNGGNPQAGIGPDDTIVFVVDIHDAISQDQYGDESAEEAEDLSDLPVEITGELGGPVDVSVKDGAEEPSEVQRIILAESDGEPVGGEGTTIYIQYTAVTWDNSVIEKSSELGGIQSTPVGDQTVFGQLEGVPVGSRVLLIVPATEQAPAMAAVVDVVGQSPAPAPTED